jgi:hypothetical protein
MDLSKDPRRMPRIPRGFSLLFTGKLGCDMIVVLAVGGDERRGRPSEQHGRWLAGVRVPSLAHPGQGQRASYDPLKL